MAVGKNLDQLADDMIDASGKYIFPEVWMSILFGSFGGRLFETTEAAAVGGTTTIVDFVPQEKGDSLGTAVEKHAAKASGISCVDFGFHSMVMDMQPGYAGSDKRASQTRCILCEDVYGIQRNSLLHGRHFNP